MLFTSASANKRIKDLNARVDFLYRNMALCRMYEAEEGEKPVIPEFNFTQTQLEIAALFDEICIIKHAINEHNASTVIRPEGFDELTIDTALVKMAQLSRDIRNLDAMRSAVPVQRLSSEYMSRGAKPTYRYTNYDTAEANGYYEHACAQLAAIQLALDASNSTDTFTITL